MPRRIGTGTAFWCGVLGFALGGFFDGILLHQILQWHHLLSLVPAVTSLRAQVLWDGYFHALMYVLASVALVRLWWINRTREGRPKVAPVLIGFGLWHVVDAVLSHWVLGIHRIRTFSDNPLFWDVLWLVVFGLIPLVIGLVMKPPTTPPNRAASLSAMTIIALISGFWAFQPPSNQPAFTTVVFGGDRPMDRAMAAIVHTDASLVWSAPDMSVAVLEVDPAKKADLFRHGALLVSGSGTPAGCFGWSRP